MLPLAQCTADLIIKISAVHPSSARPQAQCSYAVQPAGRHAASTLQRLHKLTCSSSDHSAAAARHSPAPGMKQALATMIAMLRACGSTGGQGQLREEKCGHEIWAAIRAGDKHRLQLFHRRSECVRTSAQHDAKSRRLLRSRLAVAMCASARYSAAHSSAAPGVTHTQQA